MAIPDKKIISADGDKIMGEINAVGPTQDGGKEFSVNGPFIARIYKGRGCAGN